MSVRIKKFSPNGIEQPEWVERHPREVTYDNMSFVWGMNENRNFADDGVGLGFALTASNIVQDTIPFGNSRS